MTEPNRLQADSPDVPSVLALVQDAFAFMAPRINPPSSMNRLTIEAIRSQCDAGEVWALGTPPHACLFLSEKSDALYIGKLAVSEAMRGKGLAHQMIEMAARRARERGFHTLELETRIELTENHQAFMRMGFSIVAHGTHDGFDRPTFVVMRKEV